MNESSLPESLRVAVLMGGVSAEREISLASGICVASALEQAGHQPRAIDPAEVDLVDIDWRAFDVCFIALHGGAGEDGRVQSLLDSLDVPYTGSGPAASALAMSKSAAKNRWLEVGVPTAPFALGHALEPIGSLMLRARAIGFPVVIKPDAGGSSLGVSIARNEDELQCAVAECQFYDLCVMVEAFLKGREFTVTLIGDRVAPPVEIVTGGELFSYESKYHTTKDAPAVDYRFDTGLTAREQTILEQTAVSAAEALGTSGLVRVDLIVAKSEPDGAERPYVLEVNTVPGMTEHSLSPLAAAQLGLDMPRLCHQLICDPLALEVSR